MIPETNNGNLQRMSGENSFRSVRKLLEAANIASVGLLKKCGAPCEHLHMSARTRIFDHMVLSYLGNVTGSFSIYVSE